MRAAPVWAALLTAGLALVGAQGAAAEEPAVPAAVTKALETVRPHPRLLWPAGGEEAVRKRIAAEPLYRETYEAVRAVADHMLKEAPVAYRKEGRRLLGRSREALARVVHCGFMFRMTGDRRYAARAAAEMRAAAAMPDWNPSHFLDTAEMTLALAIGYDWLQGALSPEDRETIRAAIVAKGLGPYLKPGSRHGWERGGNNWNQVCHAGMTAGALALAEDDPARAAAVVARALAGLPYAMKVYAPDGTYPEGPGYWNYGTTFNVLVVQMLETALGSDFGIASAEGFMKTADYLLQITGPTLRYFNFSDCGTGTDSSPAMFWFAARTGRPGLLWFQRPLLARDNAAVREDRGAKCPDRFYPMTLVWGPDALPPVEPGSPLHWYGKGPNPLTVHRTAWDDPNGVYLAVKAGSPGASHAHMDIGSFVLDADGVRWSLDLGAQDYNAMEQRGLNIWDNRNGSDRWRIFRYHNRAHSTLMADGQEQVVRSFAPVAEFSNDAKQAFTVVDMTETYKDQLAGAIRRFTLLPDRSVAIEDRLRGGEKDAMVRWAMVTPGRVRPGGAGAVWLEADGKRLHLAVTRPENTPIFAVPADPPNDYDEPNRGVWIVGFEAAVPAGRDVAWRVVLSPKGKGAE